MPGHEVEAYRYELIGVPKGRTIPVWAKSLELLYVTPEDASKFKHAVNRSVKSAKVAKHTADMDEGRWDDAIVNVIRVDHDGFVTDGQHRLRAIAKTRKRPGIWMVKATTASDPSTVPDGTPRTWPDAFTMRGVNNSGTVVAMLKVLRKYLDYGHADYVAAVKTRGRAKGNRESTKVEFDLLYRLYLEHKGDVDRCVQDAKTYCAKVRLERGAVALIDSEVALAFYVAARSERKDARHVVERVLIAAREDVFKHGEEDMRAVFHFIRRSHKENRYGAGGSQERLGHVLGLL